MLLQIHLVVSSLMFLETRNKGLTSFSSRLLGYLILTMSPLRPSGIPLMVSTKCYLFLAFLWTLSGHFIAVIFGALSF